MEQDLKSLYDELNKTVIERDVPIDDEYNAQQGDELKTAEKEKDIDGYVSKISKLLDESNTLEQLNPNTLLDLSHACKAGGLLYDHYEGRSDSHAVRVVHTLQEKVEAKIKQVGEILAGGSEIQKLCNQVMRNDISGDLLNKLWQAVMNARQANYSHFSTNRGDKVAVEYALESLRKRHIDLRVVRDIANYSK